MLIGRLGTDPEMRYTPNGVAVTSFRLAVNRRGRRGEEGEAREETDWFTVVAWQQLAEICNQYLKKAARVYIEGRLQVRSWEDQSGQKRTTTEIVANDMIMLDTRRSAERSDGGELGSESEELEDIPF
jgi:single-strand DNA-binding protein